MELERELAAVVSWGPIDFRLCLICPEMIYWKTCFPTETPSFLLSSARGRDVSLARKEIGRGARVRLMCDAKDVEASARQRQRYGDRHTEELRQRKRKRKVGE